MDNHLVNNTNKILKYNIDYRLEYSMYSSLHNRKDSCMYNSL